MGVVLSKRTASSIRQWIIELRKSGDQPKMKRKIHAFNKLRLPYKYLSCGSNRIVYDMGKKVLKVAISSTGIRNIRNEAELYRDSPKRLRKHLGKVYASGDGWLIMKKIKKQIPRTSLNKRRIIDVKKKFVKRGINPIDIFYVNRPEPEWRNMGLKQGRKVVVLDYGHFKWKERSHQNQISKRRPISKDQSSVPTKNKEAAVWRNPMITSSVKM
jgi:hypothetical protein